MWANRLGLHLSKRAKRGRFAYLAHCGVGDQLLRILENQPTDPAAAGRYASCFGLDAPTSARSA